MNQQEINLRNDMRRISFLQAKIDDSYKALRDMQATRSEILHSIRENSWFNSKNLYLAGNYAISCDEDGEVSIDLRSNERVIEISMEGEDHE